MIVSPQGLQGQHSSRILHSPGTIEDRNSIAVLMVGQAVSHVLSPAPDDCLLSGSSLLIGQHVML